MEGLDVLFCPVGPDGHHFEDGRHHDGQVKAIPGPAGRAKEVMRSEDGQLDDHLAADSTTCDGPDGAMYSNFCHAT